MAINKNRNNKMPGQLISSLNRFMRPFFYWYLGDYFSLNAPVKSRSLQGLQKQIEALGEYSNPSADFKDYETAWITEYNLFGRITARYYFSMKKAGWQKIESALTDYASWDSAIKPVKAMAQWLLQVLGYKAAQIKQHNKLVREMKIDSLYGN